MQKKNIFPFLTGLYLKKFTIGGDILGGKKAAFLRELLFLEFFLEFSFHYSQNIRDTRITFFTIKN